MERVREESAPPRLSPVAAAPVEGGGRTGGLRGDLRGAVLRRGPVRCGHSREPRGGPRPPPSGQRSPRAPARPRWFSAASAAALEEEPVQSKTTEPLETADGTETAGAPRSGAANGEDPSKVAGVAAPLLPRGKRAAGAAPEPRPGGTGKRGTRAVQRTAGGNGAAAEPPCRKARRSCCPRWTSGELDGQGRSFCTVSAQTLEALCGGAGGGGRFLPEAGAALGENCRVILAE